MLFSLQLILVVLLYTTLLITFFSVSSAGQGKDVEHALKDAIEIDFSIYNRNDEFYITILSEEGYTICEGKVSRTILDQIHCAYDKDVIKYGDNLFFITIYSLKKKEIIAKKTTHFYYDGHNAHSGDGISWKFNLSPLLKPFKFIAAKIKQTGGAIGHQSKRLGNAILALPAKFAQSTKIDPKDPKSANKRNSIGQALDNQNQKLKSVVGSIFGGFQKVVSKILGSLKLNVKNGWKKSQLFYKAHEFEILVLSGILTTFWIAWMFYAILIQSKDPASITMNPFHLSPFHKPPPPPPPSGPFGFLKNLGASIKYHSNKSVMALKGVIVDKPVATIREWHLRPYKPLLGFLAAGVLLILMTFDGSFDYFASKTKKSNSRSIFPFVQSSPPDRPNPPRRSSKNNEPSWGQQVQNKIQQSVDQVDKEDLKTRFWIASAILAIQGIFMATKNRTKLSGMKFNHFVPFQNQAHLPKSYF